MIQINVFQQLKSPIGTTKNYDVNGVIEIEGDKTNVQGTASLMRTDRSILVKGTINIDREFGCSRCLSPISYKSTLNIEEEFFPSADINNGASLPVPDEPGSFTIDEYNILDLTEAIQQYSVLVRPMKPLCREDCAGLCPVCGTNLNESSCECPREPTDTRWGKLRNLAHTEIETPVLGQKGTK